MKKKKITLEKLSIKSFVTSAHAADVKTIKGGVPNPIIIIDGITAGFGNCVASVNFCKPTIDIACPTVDNCGSTPACTEAHCQGFPN